MKIEAIHEKVDELHSFLNIFYEELEEKFDQFINMRSNEVQALVGTYLKWCAISSLLEEIKAHSSRLCALCFYNHSICERCILARKDHSCHSRQSKAFLLYQQLRNVDAYMWDFMRILEDLLKEALKNG